MIMDATVANRKENVKSGMTLFLYISSNYNLIKREIRYGLIPTSVLRHFEVYARYDYYCKRGMSSQRAIICTSQDLKYSDKHVGRIINEMGTEVQNINIMNLIDYFLSNGNRPAINKPMAYFPIYEQYFQQYINGYVKVLEIGVQHGGSLMMWRDYFGKKSEIVGIDIDPRCKSFESSQIKIYTGDQSNADFLKTVIDNEKYFDIIIDDGGHYSSQQITSFQKLFNYVTVPGVYIVEDVGTSYMPEYGGGQNSKSTFIEYAKSLIDQPYCANDENCFTVHFHPDIIVFERYKKSKPDTRFIGKPRL